jgi:hydrogenase small subunit
MPGFPDRFMPFMEANPLGAAAAAGRRFTYGPVLAGMRRRAMRRRFDREPDWRAPGTELLSGYERPTSQA